MQEHYDYESKQYENKKRILGVAHVHLLATILDINIGRSGHTENRSSQDP